MPCAIPPLRAQGQLLRAFVEYGAPEPRRAAWLPLFSAGYLGLPLAKCNPARKSVHGRVPGHFTNRGYRSPVSWANLAYSLLVTVACGCRLPRRKAGNSLPRPQLAVKNCL